MNLRKLVQAYILNQKVGSPIFISDIMDHIAQYNDEQKPCTQVRKNVNVILMRMVNEGKCLKRFGAGVYYRDEVINTEKNGIDSMELIKRTYIKDKKGLVFGYLTGEIFMYQIKLLADRPCEVVIATNAKRNAICEIEDINFKLINPPTTVSTENFRYLQVLDLIKNDLAKGSNLQYEYALSHFMNKYLLEEAKLVALAVEYYSQKVVLKVADFISNKVYLDEQKEGIIITIDTINPKEISESIAKEVSESE
ncbi:hypothetical protein [Carnobacterium inhibens]|uniref:hypothetical protein n=1 Tax=Carnobacterium inhibens TaxID=147709 RepID=UPI0005564CA5|nr:hypothetical protein [Carnobacterium inhibens]